MRRPRGLALSRPEVLIAASPLLLALALRVGWAPLAERLGIRAYEPVLAILAVAVHVPLTFGMAGALMLLDDIEEGAFAIVRTSPTGVRRYVIRRLGSVTLLGAAALAIAAPLSGIVPARAFGALILAVPIAPLMTIATLAVAKTRVQGAAAAKILALPVYLPIAAWWLTGPTGWLLAPLPAYWIVRTWDAPHPLMLLGGLTCLTAWLVPLTYRATRTLA